MTELYKRLHELFEYKDGYFIRKITIQGSYAGKKVGISSKGNYSQIGVDGKKMSAHRAIFLYHHGYLPEFIDHIDGNKNNNAIENLREATRSENGMNQKSHKNSKSNIKNVHWKESIKAWVVKLNVNRKRIHLGAFKDLELAELIALEAREKYHGIFANHGLKGVA